jgi:nicotinamidase-related amidase
MHLDLQRAALALIDVQEKLLVTMHNPDVVLKQLVKLVAGAKTLDIPILWNEQNPERLGPTAAPLREILASYTKPIPKMSFGCCGSAGFMTALKATGRDQILIAGIEAHVCVYQTAEQLLQQKYHFQIVADAVSSRNPLDQEITLLRIAHEATIQQTQLPPLTTTEAALFELMKTAEHPRFKDILKIIR